MLSKMFIASSSKFRGRTSFLLQRRSTQRSISLSSRPMMTSITRVLASAMAMTIIIYSIAHKGSIMVITTLAPLSTIIHLMPHTSTVTPTTLTITFHLGCPQLLHIHSITVHLSHLTIYTITNTILEAHTHTTIIHTTHQLFHLTSTAILAIIKDFHIHIHSGRLEGWIPRSINSNRCP